MTIYGETPYVVHGKEEDYKRLFFSRPEQALSKSISLMAGYGVLRAGTPVALNKSAAGKADYYLPYNPTVPSSSDVEQVGRAFLLQDGSGTSVYVTLEDSYKFNVGDDIIILDANTSTTSSENLGAITAIDRTTYVHMAVITFTATISASFTVAQSACIQIEAGATSANSYSEAIGILMATVDTGKGENCKGATAPMLISNAIVYKGAIPCYDSALLTDLSASLDGNLIIIK